MNPRRHWVWVGYWAGVALLALVLLGVSGQVLALERAEARGRAEKAQQEASRLALWRMDSWLAPVLAREARRPYFEYRAVLPVGRAYENMWAPIGEGEPVVASALIAGVPEDERATGPGGERLIRLHLQIEPDGVVTSPQHPSDAQLVNLVLADPLIAMGVAERDRAGAILSVLSPMVAKNETFELSRASGAMGPTTLGSVARGEVVADSLESSSALGGLGDVSQSDFRESKDADEVGLEVDLDESVQGRAYNDQDAGRGEYAARQELANLAQNAEAPEQQFYKSIVVPSSAVALAEEANTPAESEGFSAPASVAKARSANERTDGLLDSAEALDEEIALAGTDPDLMADRVAEQEVAEQGVAGPGVVGAGAAGERRKRADDAPGTSELLYSRGQSEAQGLAAEQARAVSLIRIGAMQPRWLRSPTGEPELVYLRRVEVGGAVYQQGVWFDWPVLQRALLASSGGLPDEAWIDPVTRGLRSLEINPQHQLATVPAVLRLPPVGSEPLGMTPARWSLLLTWFAVLASVGAIGVVLRTAMRLSDRRVRFVGAVTHELRTPLTTFRLYSQMLADGMVTEESARREYLNTLKQESARLAGIVENVLAYARLNRAGRDQHRVRTEVITPEALLVRLRPGLSRRAEQSSMDLIVSNEAGAQGTGGGRELMVDPQSVERVLTNLVDNACKYAAPAGEDDPDAETRIHLDMRVVGETLEILVADYGPGIDSADRGKVFGEFQRGRAGQRADRSGLGLGLALSRGLARESGGDLRLVRRRGHGAEFLLTLPMQPAAGAARG